jgi:Vacuolar sorting-associated protein 13, N-terminal/N-terminal region of Chorein or VPS13
MLERLVADILVRILGQYVAGITPETVNFGVWSGHLELHRLALRPEALAFLFETLGLDLPVTVIAGYVGTLTLRAPWKALRSSPVILSIHDLTVVAAPVSDGDQEALTQREARLKIAHLETDDALRRARASVPASSASFADKSRLARWRRMFTTGVINNIQLDVQNVIIQYQDASSVRARPYTVSLAVESLRAVSTDAAWKEAFITDPDAPSVHKVLHLEGLVSKWEMGIGDSSHTCLTPAEWSADIRRSKRHVISPMNGELHIALLNPRARYSLIAGEMRTQQPRVQMDLCFPNVAFSFDDFQYHTMLATIAYLSDIDRKVRAKTPRGRWAWAVNRLLPRFKDRHAARLRFTVDGIRRYREKRELYIRARKVVARAQLNRAERDTASSEASVLRDMELILPLADVLAFRDLADEQRGRQAAGLATLNTAVSTSAYSRLWQMVPVPRASTPEDQELDEGVSLTQASVADNASALESGITVEPPLGGTQVSDQEPNTANFRMGFLLGRGSIQLATGGFLTSPVDVALLVFHELRVGVTTGPGSGLVVEALLGTLEVLDLKNDKMVMYPRVQWSGHERRASRAADIESLSFALKASGNDYVDVETDSIAHEALLSETLDDTFQATTLPADCELRSYPTRITEALQQIRDGYEKPDPAMFRPSKMGLASPGMVSSVDSSSSSSLHSDGGSVSTLRAYRIGQREDLTIPDGEPLDYLIALRLQNEPIKKAKGRNVPCGCRLAMDLAMGGMEAFVDGPQGAFVSAISFWRAREKSPSVMRFLSQAAAPRLASLRMNLQQAILDQKGAPMKLDLLVRGPRFILPGPQSRQLSLVLDLGTFSLCTTDEDLRAREHVPGGPGGNALLDSTSLRDPAIESAIQYTDYRTTVSDLGMFLVSDAGRKVAERLIKPFSLRLLLKVLVNASFLEAVMDRSGNEDLARMHLYGQLSSVKTTISHTAFREILEVVKRWRELSVVDGERSGADQWLNGRLPRACTSGQEPEVISQAPLTPAHVEEEARARSTSLVAFDARLQADAVSLELRDLTGRRVVTLTTHGTSCKIAKSQGVDVDFRVHMVTVEDGSRGATAPFRQLLYAGSKYGVIDVVSDGADGAIRHVAAAETDLDSTSACVRIAYAENMTLRTQELDVHVMSLNVFIVRETYLALADFFYKQASSKPTSPVISSAECEMDSPVGTMASISAEYLDPFAALGTSTSTAVRAMTERAGRGVEKAKQVFALRGQLKVSATLDGFDLTLVTAEGAIASAEVHACAVRLIQSPTGVIDLSGDLERFKIRDLTASYDILSQTATYTRQTAGLAQNGIVDGWTLHVPEDIDGEVWLRVRLTGIRIVYVQRFVFVLQQYLSGLMAMLSPVLAIKGGLSNVFDHDDRKDVWIEKKLPVKRWRLDVATNHIDVIMPRHSQSPHEGLRFVVGNSSISNDDFAAPGYLVGLRIAASNISSYVLHSADGDVYCSSPKDQDIVFPLPTVKPLTFAPLEELTSFSSNVEIGGKLDLWRLRRCPTVDFNFDGIPVLRDGELEKEYDPQEWIPAIRVRLLSPVVNVRLCEAEYSILYLVLTESLIERPDIEFTDLGAHGLKTPVLPPRYAIQPIMLASNRLPANYSVIFEVCRALSFLKLWTNSCEGKVSRLELTRSIQCTS